MNLQFRPAQPPDVEQAIPLIYSAAVEAFDYAFGGRRHRAVDFLKFAFLSGGLFGYDNHVVAVSEGRIAGIGAFYSGAKFNRLASQNTLQILKFYGVLGSASIISRCLRLKKLLPPPDQTTEYIADLGVHEAMQGRGIGSELLKHQQEQARLRGKNTYALDVAAHNSRAQKLYERLGFKVAEERELILDEKNGTALKAHRMTMKI